MLGSRGYRPVGSDERTLQVWAEGEDDGDPRQLQTWIRAASRATCGGTWSTGRGGAQVPSTRWKCTLDGLGGSRARSAFVARTISRGRRGLPVVDVKREAQRVPKRGFVWGVLDYVWSVADFLGLVES